MLKLWLTQHSNHCPISIIQFVFSNSFNNCLKAAEGRLKGDPNPALGEPAVQKGKHIK